MAAQFGYDPRHARETMSEEGHTSKAPDQADAKADKDAPSNGDQVPPLDHGDKTRGRFATVGLVFATFIAIWQSIDDWEAHKTKLFLVLCAAFGAWAWIEQRLQPGKRIRQVIIAPIILWLLFSACIAAWWISPRRNPSPERVAHNTSNPPSGPNHIESKWQPPQLAAHHDSAFVRLGETDRHGTEYTYYISDLKLTASTGFVTHGTYPISALVTNNRLLVDVTFYANRSPIRFKGSVPQQPLPRRFDWRATENAIEVFDGSDEICCQIIYRRSNWIYLNGVFLVTNSHGSGDTMWWAYGPTNWFSSNSPINYKNLRLKSIREK